MTRIDVDVRSRTRLAWVGVLVVLLALLSATVAFAEGECPGDWKIYIGGPVQDTNAARGTQNNPVANQEEAKDLCMACGGAAYLYEYDALQGAYGYYGVCSTVFPETSGSPLAQSALTALVVLGALGLLTWGLYTRLRLKLV